MIDTHCHLNFKRFKGTVDTIISEAMLAGVESMIVPGTEIDSSRQAIEIAGNYDTVYATAGIHPHHVFDSLQDDIDIQLLLEVLDDLLTHKEVIAVGEIGVDLHQYSQTKYEDYELSEKFLKLQEVFFKEQIGLALKHNLPVIMHNREAADLLMQYISDVWDDRLTGMVVFHCCEADLELLQFAQDHGFYIGVDGDVTYDSTKQEFIARVPLEMLVLETDAPFLLPEPLKSQKQYPNTPVNLSIIAESVSKIKQISYDELDTVTTLNAKKLFNLD